MEAGITLALELGVPGVGIPPGMLASNSDPLPFSKVGDCLNVVSEDCTERKREMEYDIKFGSSRSHLVAYLWLQ